MTAGRLDRALWGVPIPEAAAAEERGWRIVAAAYARREANGPLGAAADAGRQGEGLGGAAAETEGQGGGPVGADAGRQSGSRDALGQRRNRAGRGRRPLPRLALSLPLAALLAALLLSPAGAAVRDWVGDAFSPSPPRPEPTLARIPGGGRLLVQSGVGSWVVQSDGSRHLLGEYDEATWSPHGLFVAAVSKRRLSALEPDGSQRWSVTAPARALWPRWSPSGERIAYWAGPELRTIAGDGSDDRPVASVPPSAHLARVAPAWSPDGDEALAYLTGSGQIRIVNGRSGRELTQAPSPGRVTWIEWGAGGREILEASPQAVKVRSVRGSQPLLGHVHRLPIAKEATVVGAALAPRRRLVALTLTYWKRHGTYSTVFVYGPGDKPRLLLKAPGSLGHDVTWSPDGRRLLVPWPGANQWLFLPLGRGQASAVADISNVFEISFPRVEGWCCQR